MSKALPARADLAYLKKMCKERVRAARAAGKKVMLARVQLEVAREYGFGSWGELRKKVEAMRAGTKKVAVPGADVFLKLVAEGKVEAVRMMVGEVPGMVNGRGKHPTWGGRPQALHVAIERDQWEVFEVLLAAGADVNGDNTEYGEWSPLMLAIHWKRTRIRDELLRHGAKVGLIEALMLGDDAAVEKWLKVPGILLGMMPNGGTPLHFRRTRAAVAMLVAAGVDAGKKDKYGKTALEAMAALGIGDVGKPSGKETKCSFCGKSSAEVGAMVEGPDEHFICSKCSQLSQNIFSQEKRKGQGEAVEAMKALGVPWDATTLATVGDLAGLKAMRDDGVTLAAFHAAATHGKVPVVRWMVENGVDVNGRMKPAGATALHQAAWQGKLEMVKVLVELGADWKMVDEEHGTTPAVWARTAEKMFHREGCWEVAEFLEGLASAEKGGSAGASMEDVVNIFLELAVESPDLAERNAEAAQVMLKDRPVLGAVNIYAAAATGNAEALRGFLERDAGLARAEGGVRKWVPLLYLCFSRLLKEEKSKKGRGKFAECARLLIEAGADVNAFFVNSGDRVKESALYGACGRANCAEVTKVLLAAGAEVNDGETMYHVAEHDEHTCLRMILERKPENAQFCFCHQLDHEDAAGVRVFLEYGMDPNWMIDRGAMDIRGLRPLHFAILRGRSVAVIKELIRGGADVMLTTSAGLTPYAYAARLGQVKVVEYLAKHGGKAELSPKEQFLADCVAGRVKEARRALKEMPGLMKELSAHDQAALTSAAGLGRLGAVRLMADLGFELETAGAWGGTALHQAAWAGHVKAVKFLLERGARVDSKQQWGGDALQTAIHGSMHGGHARGAEIVKMIAKRMTAGDWERYLKQAKQEGAVKVLPVLEALIAGGIKAPREKPAPHGPQSFAMIEKRHKGGNTGNFWREELAGETLKARQVEGHIRKKGVEGHYRRITVWAVVGGKGEKMPRDVLERFEGDWKTRPTGGEWRRIAWPPAGRRPTVDEATEHAKSLGAGEFRIFTVTRMLNAFVGKKGLIVRAGHVTNPDEGGTPTLEAVVDVGAVASTGIADDPFVQSLPKHRRTHKITEWKPIMDAAFGGDAARIKKLLAAGADPNVVSTTPAKYRPLHRAIEFKKTEPRGMKHEDVVRVLLEGGADPHLGGGWEQLTALGIAAIGEVRFVPLLLERFVPLNLFHAAVVAEENRVAALLTADKKLAKVRDANGWTALHYAASSAYFASEKKGALLAIARRLIEAGADVGATYLWENEWPIPVMYGCCGRHDFPEMAELLIHAGASACDGESVYHAADEGHTGALAVIERLTDKMKLAAECSFALPSVMHWGRTRGIKWFLEHGADVNALSKVWGNSALHEAAVRGSAEKVIALLLKYGADPKRKNKAGKTAVEMAREKGHGRIVKQLGG